jgi:hypothetical protein
VIIAETTDAFDAVRLSRLMWSATVVAKTVLGCRLVATPIYVRARPRIKIAVGTPSNAPAPQFRMGIIAHLILLVPPARSRLIFS